jgi:pSer/pThr/pTyr-binding forkhead associated (FHA) protein
MKSFLTACGLEDSLQLVVETPSSNEGDLRSLSEPFAVIGRDPRVDVVLDHSQVSRRHVYLQVVMGRAFWVDLESRTGTRGERDSQKCGWLEGGRTLCVGPYVIRRFVGDAQADERFAPGELPREIPLFAQAFSHAPLPEVRLEFLNGPSQSMSRPVRRVLSLIGSASGCKFRLTDPSVSRFHSSLLQTPGGLWIVDLLGQKGITVNDVPVRSSRLVDGDVVKIGRYQIRIRCRHRGAGSGNGLPDLGRTTLVARLPRPDRTSNGLKFRDWMAASTPLEPGSGSAKAAQFPMPLQAGPSFPKFEMVPSDANVPVNLAQSELTESMLVPLVNQFGLMQQQMFDQFQQAMAMMVQMFGTMHRDQMEVIRAELNQLHELTEEFHALKNELASRSREQGEPSSSKLAVDGTWLAGSTTSGPGVSPTSPVSATPEPWSGPEAARLSLALPFSPAPLPSSTPEQPPSLNPPLSPTPPLSSPPAPQPSSEQLEEPGRGSPAKPGTARRADASDRDTVVWLHQRIIALQQERESRWQKILKLLPGMS